VSKSLQGAVSPDGCHCCIVDGTRNGVQDDLEQDQENDPGDTHAVLSNLTVHGASSFRARFFLIRSIPQIDPLDP